MDFLKTRGVQVLENDSVVINERINLVGVMNMMGKRFDFLPPYLTKDFLHVNVKHIHVGVPLKKQQARFCYNRSQNYTR